MRKSWLIVLACMPLLSLHPRTGGGINISITGIRNSKGHILVSLYNSKAGFPDKANKALRRAQLVITNRSASYVFSDLPSGTYAVAVLHDENDDQKMNTNMLGIPKEGYGFSNNVMGSFGPPAFERAAVSYTTGTTVSISIKTRYGL